MHSNCFLVFLHCRIIIKLAQTGQLIHQYLSSHVSDGCAQAFGARNPSPRRQLALYGITTTAYCRCVLTIMGKAPWQPGNKSKTWSVVPRSKRQIARKKCLVHAIVGQGASWMKKSRRSLVPSNQLLPWTLREGPKINEKWRLRAANTGNSFLWTGQSRLLGWLAISGGRCAVFFFFFFFF